MKKLILWMILITLLTSCLGKSEDTVEETPIDWTIVESTIEKPAVDEWSTEIEIENKENNSVETPDTSLDEEVSTEVVIEKQVKETKEVEVKVEEKTEIEKKETPVVSDLEPNHEETTAIPDELTDELTDDIINDIDAILNEI